MRLIFQLSTAVLAANTLTAQAQAASRCIPLGIVTLTCESCNISVANDGAVAWMFQVEPVVRQPAAASPFRVGDVIVSVNGQPITTRGAGALLSASATTPLDIVVRREGSTATVRAPSDCPLGMPLHVSAGAIQSSSGASGQDVALRGGGSIRFGSDGRFTMGTLLQSSRALQDSIALLLEELQRTLQLSRRERERAISAQRDSLRTWLDVAASRSRGGADTSLMQWRRELQTRWLADLATVDRARAQVEQAQLQQLVAAVRAGSSALGFAVECAGCTVMSDSGTRRVIRYRSDPTVSAVTAGSAAAVAGLRVGDVVTSVDGVALQTEAGAAAFARLGARPAESIRLGVLRDGRMVVVTIPPRR